LFGETFQQTAGKSKTPAKATAQPSGLAEAIGITSGHLRDFAKGAGLADGLMKEARQLTDQYRFFHWHLAFPEVFRRYPSPPTQRGEAVSRGELGGFDVMLGNPPWERPKPEPAKYFAASRPDIAEAQTSAVREKLLVKLQTEAPQAFAEWAEYERFVLGCNG